MKYIILIILATLTTFAADVPPHLDRAEARRILEGMEWREITIVAIAQGVDAKGAVAPIYATVVALATRDLRHQPVRQGLTYDRELGWHLLELGEKSARIWTKDGYREVKPWTAFPVDTSPRPSTNP